MYFASCGARIFAGRAPLPPRRGIRILAVTQPYDDDHIIAPPRRSANSESSMSAQPTESEEQDVPDNVPDEMKKRVTLKAPYPEMYPGCDTDRMSVQYAVMYLVDKVGLQYDFKQSFSKAGPIDDTFSGSRGTGSWWGSGCAKPTPSGMIEVGQFLGSRDCSRPYSPRAASPGQHCDQAPIAPRIASLVTEFIRALMKEMNCPSAIARKSLGLKHPS